MASPLDDLYARLDAAISKLEPDLADAFFQSIWVFRAQTDLQKLVSALEAGDVGLVIEMIFDTPDAWNSLSQGSQNAIASASYGDLAHELSDMLEAVHGKGASPPEPVGLTPEVLRVRFPDPRYAAQLDQSIGQMITQIDDTTRAGVRQYLEQSLAAGRNPVDTITELVGRVQPDGSREGGIIGLTDQQAQAVLNYRAALENRSQTALDRALRDRRYDPSVLGNSRLLSDGSKNPAFKPLTQDQIDNLVTRYEGRMLGYRGETIARTEAMRAQRIGTRMTWQTAIDNGKVSAADLTKTWWTAMDSKVRPAHQVMQGVTIGFNEYFQTDDEGPILEPMAPNCRCILFYQPATVPGGANSGLGVAAPTPAPEDSLPA